MTPIYSVMRFMKLIRTATNRITSVGEVSNSHMMITAGKVTTHLLHLMKENIG